MALRSALLLGLGLIAGCEDIRVVNTDLPTARDAATSDARVEGARDAGAPCDACTGYDARPVPLDASVSNASDAAGLDGSGSADGASSPIGYPRGPFGVLPGDTITDLKWQGYVNPTAVGLASTAPFAAYSLDDVRHSGNEFAYVHVADFDCPGCNRAANELGQLGKQIVDLGVTVVEVLVSHDYSLPATRSYLDAWISAHDLTVTSVIDVSGTLDTLNTVGVRETSLILDTKTMKVVWRYQGDLGGGQDPSSVTFALAELKRRLGD